MAKEHIAYSYRLYPTEKQKLSLKRPLDVAEKYIT